MSTLLTERANEVMPSLLGDVWKNSNFTVLFDRLDFSNPCPEDEEDEWTGICKIEGDVVVHVYEDGRAPVDVIPLVISLRERPLYVPPDSSSTGYSFQLKWRPDGIKDIIYRDSIVPSLRGNLTCYVLLKNST